MVIGIVVREHLNLLRMLLNAGVYDSVQAAYEDGVPVGAFVVIDDRETPELEFNVQIVRPGRIPRELADNVADNVADDVQNVRPGRI